MNGFNEIIAIFNKDKVSFIILVCIMLFILISSFTYNIKKRIERIMQEEYDRGVQDVLSEYKDKLVMANLKLSDTEIIYKNKIDNMAYYVKEESLKNHTQELMPSRTQAIHEAVAKINALSENNVTDVDYVLAKNYLHVRKCYELFEKQEKEDTK